MCFRKKIEPVKVPLTKKQAKKPATSETASGWKSFFFRTKKKSLTPERQAEIHQTQVEMREKWLSKPGKKS